MGRPVELKCGNYVDWSSDLKVVAPIHPGNLSFDDALDNAAVDLTEEDYAVAAPSIAAAPLTAAASHMTLAYSKESKQVAENTDNGKESVKNVLSETADDDMLDLSQMNPPSR